MLDALRKSPMSVSRPSLETFRTSDYGQAGYLFARGFSFDQSERDRGQTFFHGLRKAKAIIQENTNESRSSR